MVEFNTSIISFPFDIWKGKRSYPLFPKEVSVEFPEQAFGFDVINPLTLPSMETVYRGDQELFDLAHYFGDRWDGPAVYLGNPGILCPFRGILGQRAREDPRGA